MQQQVKVVQKLSSQLTVCSNPPSSGSKASAAAFKTAQGRKKDKRGSSSSQGSTATAADTGADMPGKASLIVHEIFGTDPFSEHVLPALRQVQLQLAAPGAKFVPKAVRVIAAVGTCKALCTHLRLPQQQQQKTDRATTPAAVNGSSSSADLAWDVSSLLPLQPRKLELQLDELAGQLLLLTQPVAVMEVNFERQWPLDLNGQVTVQLPLLQKPLLLGKWMKQQRQAGVEQQQQVQQQRQQPQGEGSEAVAKVPAADGGTSPSLERSSAGVGAPCTHGREWQQEASGSGLCVVSWFEADCGAGGWLSTAPGNTKYGHWQQSVEFVQAPLTEGAAFCGGPAGSGSCFNLCVRWAVDRVKFSLV